MVIDKSIEAMIYAELATQTQVLKECYNVLVGLASKLTDPQNKIDLTTPESLDNAISEWRQGFFTFVKETITKKPE
jgi:hypothetical protein